MSMMAIFVPLSDVKANQIDNLEKEEEVAMPTADDVIKTNEVDWSEVEKVIVVYDDFTTLPKTQGEWDALAVTEYDIDNSAFRGRATQGEIYKACFSKVSWLKRSDGWTLSVTPKYGPYSGDQGFAALYWKHGKDAQWNYRNKSSMANQFYCHRDIAGHWKTPWNIEPWKSDKGYWGFVASGCN